MIFGWGLGQFGLKAFGLMILNWRECVFSFITLKQKPIKVLLLRKHASLGYSTNTTIRGEVEHRKE